MRVEVPNESYWRRQIKCQDACPVHTDARGYVRAIADGRYEDAYLIARGPNPLASICGRVCGAPCEAACRRKEIDQAVSIRALKRFVTDRFTGRSYARQSVDEQRGASSHTDPPSGDGSYVGPNTEGSYARQSVDEQRGASSHTDPPSGDGSYGGPNTEGSYARQSVDEQRGASSRTDPPSGDGSYVGPNTEGSYARQSVDGSCISLVRRLIEHVSQRECLQQEELSSFRQFLSAEFIPQNATGEKIAIIGSGPAGLAAAHDLALLGFRPVVFEMEPVPAGMLAVGIPEYRLPRELIAAEVELIRSLGVEFRCNTQVGRDITLDEIRKSHQATIIAVGLKKSRSLPLPGANGPGAIGGVEFLRDVALKRPVELHGDVVVIGGGNVAYDIARTVIRQLGIDISRTAVRQAGVRSVHLCSLESLDEMPADDAEILEGDEEGVIRHNSFGPKEILRDDTGKITGVVFQKCVRVFDEQRRFSPQFDANDLTTIPANTVIWGVGQQPDLSFADGQADLARTDRGMIQCDAAASTTTAPDIFIAGDVAYGPRLLIHAVASGKQAARSVYQFLRGHRLVEEVQLVHLDLPNYEREQDYEKLGRTTISAFDVDERRRSQTAQVEQGYSEREAVREASRCLDCGVNTIFDSEKCILCGGCADVCPETCLELVSLDRLDGDAEFQRLLGEFADDDGQFAEPMSAIVKDETKCIRCALCAERCPVGAITMERVLTTSCWTSGQGDR